MFFSNSKFFVSIFIFLKFEKRMTSRPFSCSSLYKIFLLKVSSMVFSKDNDEKFILLMQCACLFSVFFVGFIVMGMVGSWSQFVGSIASSKSEVRIFITVPSFVLLAFRTLMCMFFSWTV